jgi:hypothetical protein
MKRLIAIAFSASLALVACDKGSPPATQKEPAAAATPKPGAAHAPADVKPGSHEDWCEEHEVPESQCTRCNAELIPAFKATNDWCEEHQLPLSQDKIHNPDLVITRPPKGS